MRMRAFGWIAVPLLAFHGFAEIIDRIAVTVGSRVITESQILEAIRVTAFLNGGTVATTSAQKRKAAGRLVEQALLAQEMEATHFLEPPAAEADPLLVQVRTRFKTEADFENALRRDGVSADQVKTALLWQLTTLRFIDFRFKPAIQISQADLREYYREQTEAWRAKGVKSIPRFQEARTGLETTLTAERVNQTLDRWLSETKEQAHIVYRDEVFQ